MEQELAIFKDTAFEVSERGRWCKKDGAWWRRDGEEKRDNKREKGGIGY